MVTFDGVKQQQIDPFIKVVVKKLPMDAVIGEIGCGSGSSIKFLSPHQQWYGADMNKEVLRQIKAAHKSEKVHVRYGNVSPHLDFVDNSCDVLFCILQVHTLPNLHAAMQILLAKAAFGGRIIMVDFSDAQKALMRKDKKEVLWRERDLEEVLRRYHGFVKRVLSDQIVAYEVVKA